MEKKNCIGCIDDFYNGKNNLGVEECWLFPKAEIVLRFKLHQDTPMDGRNAYHEVMVPNCYREKGFVMLKQIPEYAK